MSKVLVNATGGEGSADSQLGGGLGGWVQASLSVTAGQTLYIYVGGDGLVRYNGGGAGNNHFGAGGGASDIRTIQSDLISSLVVAGGGGGGPWNGAKGGSGGGTVCVCLRFSFLIIFQFSSASSDGLG